MLFTGAFLWDNVLSTCPLLSWTKVVFGNGFVLEKGKFEYSVNFVFTNSVSWWINNKNWIFKLIKTGSDGVQYINGVRFYFCSLLEYFIYDVETMFPDAADYTQIFWSQCTRQKNKQMAKHSQQILGFNSDNKLWLVLIICMKERN